MCGSSPRASLNPPSSSPGRRDSSAFQRSRGFTLIELMVVIGIIVMAAGMMTPTITSFFRNRQIEAVRGEFGAAFNSARLKAVNDSGKTSLVFFKEGVRVFDERRKVWLDDETWNPERTAAGKGQVRFVLAFLGKNKDNSKILGYREWDERQGGKDPRARGRPDPSETATVAAVNVGGLPRVIFERDGSLTFATGSDVPFIVDADKVPTSFDIGIYQRGSNVACFIDLRLPGQFRSQTVPLRDIPPWPDEVAP